jgi:hypothetical protein
MRVKGFVSRTPEGLDFVPAGMVKLNPRIIDMVKDLMLMYGVRKFDVGFMPFGNVTTYTPKVADIEGLPERPPTLTQALKEVFKNLAPILFIHGVMGVELAEFTDEDLQKVKDLWKEVNNA